MLDLSIDKNCSSFEREIQEYAELVRMRQIYCGQLKKSKEITNLYLINNQNPYPFDDVRENNLLERLTSYISLRSKEEDQRKTEENQKQIAGHFIFGIKKYHGHPFEKHMARIVDHLVALYPLSDSNKIQYIEYVLETQSKLNKDKFGVYQDATWYKLANFSLSGNEKGFDRLYGKVYEYLGKKRKLRPEGAKLAYGMLNSFVNGNRNFTHSQVLDVAKLYLRLAEKSPFPIDSKLLGTLLFREEEGLNRRTLRDIASLYASHLKNSRKINDDLHEQMSRLFAGVVYWGNYGFGSKENLISVFDGMTGKKKEYTEKLQKDINESFQKRLKTMPSRANILAKTRRLFMEGSREDKGYSQEIVQNIDRLYSDIEDNAKMQGITIEEPTLFDSNAYEIDVVDKKLVNDIADIFAQAYSSRRISKPMQEAVGDMFKKIVQRKDYTEEEVETLQQHICSGEFPDDALMEFGDEIKAAYDFEQNIRQEHFGYRPKKRVISPRVVAGWYAGDKSL